MERRVLGVGGFFFWLSKIMICGRLFKERR